MTEHHRKPNDEDPSAEAVKAAQPPSKTCPAGMIADRNTEMPRDRAQSRVAGEPTAATTAEDAGKSSSPIRVLLLDDDPAVADDIVRNFTLNGLLVEVACTLAEARALLRERHRVDVAIVTLALPDGRGESLLADLESCTRQPAVIITNASAPDLEPGVLERRPVVVPKPVNPGALLRIVRTVARGYAGPGIRRFVDHFHLTKREAEATVLLTQGLGVKEIAQRMSCTDKAVYKNLASVCRRTRCCDAREVVCKVLAFAYDANGHTPLEFPAFVAPAPPQTSGT